MRLCMFAVVVALAASSAYAHGPQIQITLDNSKITTRRIVANEPYSTTLTAPASLYVIPLRETGGVWYPRPNNDFPSGLGLAYGYDQVDGGPRAFQAGSHLFINFADALTIWNGSMFVDPGTEQIGAFRGDSLLSADQALTSDGGPVPGLTVPNAAGISATYNQNAHNGARFRLLGDGTNPLAPSQDGVYLLKLQITSDQNGVLPSDVYSFLLHKNATGDEVLGAVAYLNVDPSLVQFVPEPTTGMLILIGAVGLLWERCSTCRNLA